MPPQLTPAGLPFLLLILIGCLLHIAAPQCSSFASTGDVSSSSKWQAEAPSVIRRSHTATPVGGGRVVLYGGIEEPSARQQVRVGGKDHFFRFDFAWTASLPFLLPVYLSLSLSTRLAGRLGPFPLPVHAIQSHVPRPSPQVPAHLLRLLPFPRFGHTSWRHLNSVFFYGGFTQDFSAELWRIDLPGFAVNQNATFRRVNSTSASVTPTAVYDAASAVIHSDTDSQIVVIYGGVGAGGVGVNDVQLLKLTNASSSGHCKAALIPAGETCADYGPVRADSEALWGAVDVLSKSAAAPPARSGHAAVTPAGGACVLVFGGMDPASGTIYGDLWRLCPDGSPDPSTFWSAGFNAGNLDFVWTEITPASSFVPTARYGHIMHELTLGR